MAVKLRLRRMGRKKQPHYRVVVADAMAPRDGRFVETVGYYNPLSQPARVVVDLERVDHWLEQGATPTNTVRSLITKARKGGDEKVAVGPRDMEAERQAQAEALAARRKAEAEVQEGATQATAATEEAETGAEEAEAVAEADAEGTQATASSDGEAEAEAPAAEAGEGEAGDEDEDAESKGG